MFERYFNEIYKTYFGHRLQFITIAETNNFLFIEF